MATSNTEAPGPNVLFALRSNRGFTQRHNLPCLHAPVFRKRAVWLSWYFASAATAVSTEPTQKRAFLVKFLPLLPLEFLSEKFSKVTLHLMSQTVASFFFISPVHLQIFCLFFFLLKSCFFPLQGFCQTTSYLIMKRWSIGHRLLPLPTVPYTQAHPQ